MKITRKSNEILLPPSNKNPRNSEGSFLQLKDGRIAFAYSRYIGDSFDDDAECCIACIYSNDGGESFDTENIDVLVHADEYGQKNAMSVTLRYMDNGDIGLFYLVKYEPCQRTKFFLRRYKGDFHSEYTEINVAPDKIPGDYIINNDRVIRTASGRWVVLGSHHPTSLIPGEGDEKWFDHYGIAHCFVSDDDGYTWRKTETEFTFPYDTDDDGYQEPGLYQFPDGRLRCYIRTGLGCQFECFSSDNGETWTRSDGTVFHGLMVAQHGSDTRKEQNKRKNQFTFHCENLLFFYCYYYNKSYLICQVLFLFGKGFLQILSHCILVTATANVVTIFKVTAPRFQFEPVAHFTALYALENLCFVRGN